MAAELRDITQARINAIAFDLRIPRDRRSSPKLLREKVLKWAVGKRLRMTPYGLQIFNHGEGPWPEGHWLPRGWDEKLDTVCGRWIRGLEFPQPNAAHPPICTCTAREWQITAGSSNEPGPWMTEAFQNGEATDPSLDIAPKFSHHQAHQPATKRCKISDLPTELLHRILDELVPLGNTYHFLPVRSGQRDVQVVQKFVMDAKIAQREEFYDGRRVHGGDIRHAKARDPATGSAYLALAATNKRLQHQVYARFYGGNAFVFNVVLPGRTVISEIHSCRFDKFQCWSRTTSNCPAALGPLSTRAAAYLKDVTLIATLPTSQTSKDIAGLAEQMQAAAQSLKDAKMNHLTMCLNVMKEGRDARFESPALKVACLEVQIDGNERLHVRLEEPKIETVRATSKPQAVLAPLLRGPRSVGELVLSGPMSEELAAEVTRVVKSDEARDEGRNGFEEPIDARPTKKARRM